MPPKPTALSCWILGLQSLLLPLTVCAVTCYTSVERSIILEESETIQVVPVTPAELLNRTIKIEMSKNQ